jgi:hypothetical protein
MPFEKGNKRGKGRPPNSPNKVTQDHRDLINKLISSPKDLQKDLKSLEPKERVDAIIKLLEFTTPKQSRVESNITGNIGVESIKFEDADKKK